MFTSFSFIFMSWNVSSNVWRSFLRHTRSPFTTKKKQNEKTTLYIIDRRHDALAWHQHLGVLHSGTTWKNVLVYYILCNFRYHWKKKNVIAFLRLWIALQAGSNGFTSCMQIRGWGAPILKEQFHFFWKKLICYFKATLSIKMTSCSFTGSHVTDLSQS